MKPSAYKVEYVTGQCDPTYSQSKSFYMAAKGIYEAQLWAKKHLDKELSTDGYQLTGISHICNLVVIADGVYDEDYQRMRKDIRLLKENMKKQEEKLKIPPPEITPQS